jgi:predicted transcriptional regulator
VAIPTRYETIGQIVATNSMRIRKETNALSVAIALLSNHCPGAPVVDEGGQFVGFISEFDLLRALEEGKELDSLTAGDIMEKERVAIAASTKIKDAAQIMEKNRLLNLPVEENGVVTKTVTRHDLLRAWLGFDVGIEL